MVFLLFMTAIFFIYTFRAHFFTYHHITSADGYAPSVYKCICNFLPCAIIDPSHCRPGNIHLSGTLFLGQTYKIQETYCFIFIVSKIHTMFSGAPLREMCIRDRDNMRELLKRLENPQDSLKFVHISGTNGKGSVLAYIFLYDILLL